MSYSLEHFSHEEHGKHVNKWWSDHKWPIMPEDAFPPNGYVVLYEGIPVLAGWMYLLDASWGILEWIVGDKEATKEIRAGALDILVPSLLEVAKENGKKLVFSSVKHPSLIASYKKHGMILSDEGMTNFVWRAE